MTAQSAVRRAGESRSQTARVKVPGQSRELKAVSGVSGWQTGPGAVTQLVPVPQLAASLHGNAPSESKVAKKLSPLVSTLLARTTAPPPSV